MKRVTAAVVVILAFAGAAQAAEPVVALSPEAQKALLEQGPAVSRQ